LPRGCDHSVASAFVIGAAAVLYVKNLRRMQAFYATCFKMDLADEAEDYCVLESESLTLSLVAVPERIAATIHLSVPPSRRDEVPVKLAFAVASIVSLRPLVAELGGSIDPANAQWEFRDSIHVDGIDPEGNVIQLLEPTAQTISQTRQ
jgi:predicted enzyme related to lactoylglutathione lyase